MRCDFTGVEPIQHDQDGQIIPCDQQAVATWIYRPDDTPMPTRGLHACIEHSRTYHRIAECVPDFGWRQITGPADY